MICKDCKGTKISTRTNYSHGKKSKSVTTRFCKNCGSTSIEMDREDNRKRRGRRR